MASEQSTGDSLTTVGVTGHATGPKTTRVDAGATEFTVGEDASPLEYLLGSFAACITVVGHIVAEERGIAIDDLSVHAEGELDTRTYRGESSESRAGFQSLRLRVTVDTDADEETLEAWLDTVAERCPVADNLRNGTETVVTVEAA